MPIPEWIAQWHQRLHGQIVQRGADDNSTAGRRLFGEREGGGGRWLWRRGATVHPGSTRNGGIWQALRGRWKWPWDLQRFEDRTAVFKRKRLEGFKHFSQAAKAENLNDLRDVVGAMILSECVYKGPASDVVRAVNQFNMDFGGDLVRLERVQVSLDTVPHRYLLAEADDILFASFAGTKQYRDVLADANILQETLFHAEEDEGDGDGGSGLVSPPTIAVPTGISDTSISASDMGTEPLKPRKRRKDQRVRPAAHKGFLTRAKAIPALELYQLAQQKDQRLVLCGHSLGGAVAAIATLAILRAVSAGPYSRFKGSKDKGKTASVKCITFAQPPVGNAALREYVHRKGWQRYFRTYCIPDDVIPRLLSPAYFDHYSMQQDDATVTSTPWVASSGPIEMQGEGASLSRQGLSALQQSFWRVSRLVPLTPQLAAGSAAASSAVDWLRGKRKKVEPMGEERGKNWTTRETAKCLTTVGSVEGPKNLTAIGVPVDIGAVALKGQETLLSRPMEIKEVNGGVGLAQLDTQRNAGKGMMPSPPRSLHWKGGPEDGRLNGRTSPPRSGQRKAAQQAGKLEGKTSPTGSGEPQKDGQENGKLESKLGMIWRENLQIPSMPGMPSYVPFGKLYLLGEGSAETLHASEYTRRASAVRSFVSQLRARFHAHTMKTYRTRFHNMYIRCMSEGTSFPDVVIDHINHMKWISQNAGRVKLGSIGDPVIVRSAISVIPLGWQGMPAEGGSRPMKVELQGYGLNTCTQVQASINGRWCSTVVESCIPSEGLTADRGKAPFGPGPLQTMRITIGPPLRRTVRAGGATPVTAPGNSSGEQSSQPDVDANRASEEAAAAESANGPLENQGADGGLVLPIGAGNEGGSSLNESFRGMARLEGFFEHCGDGQYGDVIIHCTNDFATVQRAVAMRLRRVRFLGLEGAGKTSLFAAVLGQEAGSSRGGLDGGILPDMEWAEGVAGGVGYVDAAGVNLQDLEGERHQLREELSKDSGPLGRRVDLVVLVHNLAHKIPMLRQPTRIMKSAEESSKPALSVLLDEVTAAGLPVVLAITNKFAASADRRNALAAAVMDVYKVPLHSTVLVNSTPYVVYRAFGVEDSFEKLAAAGAGSTTTTMAQPSAASTAAPITGVQPLRSGEKLASQEGKDAMALVGTELAIVAAPMRFIKMPSMMVRNVSNMLPFRRRETVMPVEGVKELRALVHSILEREEDTTLREMSAAILRRQNAADAAATAAFESLNESHGYLTPSAALAMKTAVGTGLGVALAVLLSFGGSSQR